MRVSRLAREQPLELVELLGPALLGTGHRLSGRHRLEVGLAHGERGAPSRARMSTSMSVAKSSPCSFVDGPAAHDEAMRTIDLVVLTPM